MIRGLLTCYLLTLLKASIWGQLISNSDYSVNATALSHSSVALANNYSQYSNPGAVGFLDRSVISLNGGLLFGLPELKLFQAGMSLRITDNDFGIFSIGSFGDLNYRETSFGLGYSRRLTNKIGLGFKGSFTQLRIPEFGSSAAFTFNAGLIWEFAENIQFGYQSQLFLDTELISLNNRFFHFLGFNYQLAHSTSILLAASYRGYWGIQGGIVHKLRDDLILNIGVEGWDPSFSMGLGFRLGLDLLLEVAFQYHLALGVSPSIGLVYTLSQKVQN